MFGAPVDIPQEARLHFTDTLLFSGPLFNSGTWPQFTDAQHARMQHVMVNKYRQVVHPPQKDEDSVPDRLILAKIERADLRAVQRVQRLRILGRLMHCGTPTPR
eukprot:6685318-Pyramimonas_sp.AAC.1